MKAKVFLTMITAVLFNAMTGAVFGMALGVSPVAGAVGANAVSLAVSGAMPVGVAREGVLKEIWTGELVKALRELLAGTWLDGIPDSSSIVDNDVIHLVEVGVDLTCLSTTPPIQFPCRHWTTRTSPFSLTSSRPR